MSVHNFLFTGRQLWTGLTSTYHPRRHAWMSSHGWHFSCAFLFNLLPCYIKWPLQLDPVRFNMFHSTTPAKLLITCQLGFVQTDIDAFAVCLSQLVHDASLHAHVHVCAHLLHPGWVPLPLLFLNAWATLFGTVLAFQNDILWVLIDNITFEHPSSAIQHLEHWDSVDWVPRDALLS